MNDKITFFPLSLLILILFTSNAFASFTIEPFYDSMFSDSTREKNPPGATVESRYTNEGTAYGIRIMGSFETPKATVNAGIQAMESTSTWTLSEPASEIDLYEDSGTSIKDKWRGNHFGIVIGTKKSVFDTHIGYSVTTFKNTDAAGHFGKHDELRGGTLEVAVGMKLFSWMKLNLTFRNHKLAKYWDASERRSYTLPEKEVLETGDYDIKEYYMGIAFPFTFFGSGK